MRNNKIPAGYFDNATPDKEIGEFCRKEFGGKDIIENITYGQTFLDREKLNSLGLNLYEVQGSLAQWLIACPSIYRSYLAVDLDKITYN